MSRGVGIIYVSNGCSCRTRGMELITAGRKKDSANNDTVEDGCRQN
jgi:hypothetical protein